MYPIDIRYEDGTNVSAIELGDALFHIAHTGAAGVVDVIEQNPRVECEHCGGAGSVLNEPVVVWTASDIADKLAGIEEHAPRGEATIEERIKAARQIAKTKE